MSDTSASNGGDATPTEARETIVAAAERELEHATGETTAVGLSAKISGDIPDGVSVDDALPLVKAVVEGDDPATADFDPAPETNDSSAGTEREAALSPAAIREHYHRIADAVEPIGDLAGNPTLLVNDKVGWYVTRENDDPSDAEIEGDYEKKRRARNFTTDYEDVVDRRLDRTLYALTSYKQPQAFERWEAATFDEGDGEYVYLNEKPSPRAEDIAGISAWGDVDLADELKGERPDLDTETYDVAEAAYDAYIEAMANLYGGRDAVFMLDSVGGAYIFGAPEATLPIARHFQDDADARERVFSEFIDRSNAHLQNAEQQINGDVEGASEVLHPDWANNINRQYKMPLAIHGDHDAVVTPVDVEDVTYREPTALDDVDDGLLEETREWTETFTSVDFEDRVENIVATLWADAYAEHGDWQTTLEAWVEAEREAERDEQRQREEAARRREQRLDELDGGVEGTPITPFSQDVYDALDRLDTGDVVKHHAADAWDTGISASSKTEFDPSWRGSSSGSSCYVDHEKNTFGDPGDGGGGYAAKAMALGEGIISDASSDLDGEKWGEAVDALRDAGYDVPVWTPEAGSKKRGGGEYDQMPFWALRKAALALGVIPHEALNEKTGEDGGTYLGFPGPKTYNNALDAVEEAGLNHGRERADTGPDYPTYDLFPEDDAMPDVTLGLVPINGQEARLEIVDENEEPLYKETLDRGFWNSGTKRGRVAGRVDEHIPGVESEVSRDAVKGVLSQVMIDSESDEFEDLMRSPREEELRARTEDVVCYPGAEDAQWVVTMQPSDSSPEQEPRELTFDSGQLHNADPGGFQQAYLGMFLEKVQLDSAEWANLTDYWLDVQTTLSREADNRLESAIESLMSRVEKMAVWTDAAGFDWDSRNGYYAEEFYDGEDAILVPGQWISQWKRDNDYTEINLSRILRERGLMLDVSKKTKVGDSRRQAWPIAASETSWTPEKAMTAADDDDDDEEKPEGLRTDGGNRLMTDGGRDTGSAHVRKLIGAPGSGKTTKLLEFAEQEADDRGTSHGNIMFCTFSTSAQQEATERFMGVYPDVDEDDLKKRVKTVHGAALVSCLVDGGLDLRNHSALDESGQLIIRRNNDRDAPYFEWFFRSEFPQITYDPDADDPIKQLEDGESNEAPAGNQLMALYDFVRSKDWALDQYYHAPFYEDLNVAPQTALDALESWEAFKDENDLMQDDDYVKMALEDGCFPATNVLLIDEFQDLSPLQCKLYEMWRDSGALERIYIAGDMHQAIYGFRGAEPTYFRDTPADEVVHHEVSRRCPDAVIDAAVPIAAPPSEHDVSNVSAWRPGGDVSHVDAGTADDLGELVLRCLDQHDEVYLLARENRQAGKIAHGLRESGVPYRDLKPNGHLNRWKQPMPMLLAGLRAYNEGRPIPMPVAKALLANTSHNPAREDAQERAEAGRLTTGKPIVPGFAEDQYRAWFPDAPRAREIVPQMTLPEWQRELLGGALRSRAENDPEDVRIGTIHAAKGLEAPCVLVFPAYSRAQLRRFQNGSEAEERRLYYVAMTRASETLRVVHDYFGGKEFPPLAPV